MAIVSPRGRRGRWSHSLIAVVIGAALLVGSGCTRTPSSFDLREVPMPAGGTPVTLATTPAGLVAAPTANGLYLRSGSGPDDTWQRVSVSWPDAIDDPSRRPIESLEKTLPTLGFQGGQQFVSHDGRFWLIARPGPDRAPRLLVSNREGKEWRLAPLPAIYNRDERIRNPFDPLSSHVLRLLSYGDNGLFLVDRRRVWQLRMDSRAPTSLRSDGGVQTSPPPDGVPPADADGAASVDADTSEGRRAGDTRVWRRLNVFDLRRAASNSALPASIRHYIPAADHRPYELLTVFGEELKVYRRWNGADRWLLVSTLPKADRQVWTLPDGSVAMLAGDRLRRSLQEGERWETLNIRAPDLDSIDGNSRGNELRDSDPAAETGAATEDRFDLSAAAVVTSEGPEGRQAAHLLAGTQRGAIYRSGLAGRSWERVREPDRDGRRVTSLLQQGDAIFAGLVGDGVLRAEQPDLNWSPAIDGFRATVPLDVTVGANGELLLATRAGLFRLTGRPQIGAYEAIHRRATSAVVDSPDGNWVVSGTLNGEIVVQTPEGRLQTYGAHRSDSPSLRVQPARTVGQQLPPSAIVDFAGEAGDGRLIAVPARGAFFETDGEPTNWRARPIGNGLESTLTHAVVMDVLAEFRTDGHLYMITRGFRRSERLRLWSSGGDRWRSVTTFAPERDPGRRTFKVNRSGRLLTAASDGLQISVDNGRRWQRLVDGADGDYPLMAHDSDRRRHLMLHRAPHATILRIVEMSETSTGAESPPRVRERRRLNLSWRGTERLPTTPIAQMAAFQSSLYLTTRRTVYYGAIPPERVQIPHGPTIVITLFILVILASLSFLFMYQSVGWTD